MDEIGLKEISYIVLKRKKLIIAIVLLMTIASFVVSKFVIQPIYSTSIMLVVGNDPSKDTKDISYTDIMAYNKIVGTYTQIITSKNILSDVVENLKFSTSVNQVKAMISVKTKTDTQIIEIGVKGTSPEEISQIANQVGDSFTKNISKIMNAKQNVNVLDRAEVPASPISPNVLMNTMIALFLGLMVGVGISFLLEYMDNTVKSIDQLEKLLGVSVIGSIPYFENEKATLEKTKNAKKNVKNLNNEIVERNRKL